MLPFKLVHAIVLSVVTSVSYIVVLSLRLAVFDHSESPHLTKEVRPLLYTPQLTHLTSHLAKQVRPFQTTARQMQEVCIAVLSRNIGRVRTSG